MKAETSQVSGAPEVEPEETAPGEVADGPTVGGRRRGFTTGELVAEAEEEADQGVVEPEIQEEDIVALEETLALTPPQAPEPAVAPVPGGPGRARLTWGDRWRILTRELPRLDDRVARVLLSILLAALLWVYVANLENPERTTFYEGVPVAVRGLAPNLKLISPPPEVRVTIQAPQSVLATLSRADVTPYIDLTGFGSGVHTVPVRADLRGAIAASGTTVRFSPENVQVQIEELITRDFPVEVRLVGTPALGYGTEPAQVTPGSVTLTGAPDAISRVANVVVLVDIEDKAGTQQGTRAPVALDQAGQQIEGIEFKPATVDVVVPIQLLLNYRVVAVRVPVLGQPAAGYRVSAITHDPTNVTVCCKPEELEPLQTIDTQPVDITGATTTVLTTTALILPPGVELYPGQPQTISVTVSIEALVTTLQVSVAPKVEGQQEGTSVVVSPDSLDVVLAGTFDQLQNLKPSDVQAVVNLQGRGPGTYSLRPQVIVPPGVTMESVNPETVTVTVIAPTPEPTLTPIPPSPSQTPLPVPSPQPSIVASPTSVPSPTAAQTPTSVPATPTRTSTPIVAQTTPNATATATPIATP
jgi:YbbR domain-containing protein